MTGELMPTRPEPYNYQRDERLDWIESEADITRDLEHCTSVELRRISRIADRLLDLRGDHEDHSEQMLGFALIMAPMMLIAFLLGCVFGPVLVETLSWTVSL